MTSGAGAGHHWTISQPLTLRHVLHITWAVVMVPCLVAIALRWRGGEGKGITATKHGVTSECSTPPTTDLQEQTGGSPSPFLPPAIVSFFYFYQTLGEPHPH